MSHHLTDRGMPDSFLIRVRWSPQFLKKKKKEKKKKEVVQRIYKWPTVT